MADVEMEERSEVINEINGNMDHFSEKEHVDDMMEGQSTEAFHEIKTSDAGVLGTSNESHDSQPPRPISPQACQMGPVLSGPGGKREQKMFTLPKLSSSQQDGVQKAKKYAMEQSIRSVLLKQTIVHQQQMATYQNAMQRPFTLTGSSMQITEQVWTKLGTQIQGPPGHFNTIYVGSINFDVREDTVKQAFLPFGPIKNVSLSWDAIANKHKGFAFVEYDVPEAATLALEQMNGVMLGGRNIKVGRPSNMPQAQPIIEKLMEEAKTYNRIYIASIHPDLGESDVQSVFEAFGKIRSCKLAPDMLRPGKHRGYGFIEYDNSQAAVDAVSSMNLFNLGGQYLRVGKSVTPPSVQQVPSFPAPMPTAAAVAAATVTAKITAMDAVMRPTTTGGMPPPGVVVPHLGGSAASSTIPTPGVVIPQLGGISAPGVVMPQSLAVNPMTSVISSNASMANAMQHAAEISKAFSHGPAQLTDAQKRLVDEDVGQTIASQESMQISGTQARHMVMQKLMRKNESRVMILRNMVGPEEVDEDLESEVIEECSKYGPVERVIIYQEKQSEDDDAETLVKIFVEFRETAGTNNAIKALDGRFFAGRQVRAHPYDQEQFDSNDLSG